MAKPRTSVPSVVPGAAGGASPFPALSRGMVPGLGLPQGGSSWVGRSPGGFNLGSRWFSFNAFDSVCFPFPLGWFDRRGLKMGPACTGTPNRVWAKIPALAWV